MEKTQTLTLEMVNENNDIINGTLILDEDIRTEEPLVENIQMWVNGTEIIDREYLGKYNHIDDITNEDGSVKKIFVLHFQREDGRITPEKEHYALIMYDNAGQDNGQPIDEKDELRWYRR